jgi:hypothetical protein
MKGREEIISGGIPSASHGVKMYRKEIYSNEDLDLRSFYYAPPPLLLLLSPLSLFLLVAELQATVCAIAAALVSPLTSALPRPEAAVVGVRGRKGRQMIKGEAVDGVVQCVSRNQRRVKMWFNIRLQSKTTGMICSCPTSLSISFSLSASAGKYGEVAVLPPLMSEDTWILTLLAKAEENSPPRTRKV